MSLAEQKYNLALVNTVKDKKIQQRPWYDFIIVFGYFVNIGSFFTMINFINVKRNFVKL